MNCNHTQLQMQAMDYIFKSYILLIGVCIIISVYYLELTHRKMGFELITDSRKQLRLVSAQNRSKTFSYRTCPKLADALESITKPKHYPENGTGVPVEFVIDSDYSKFNSICRESQPLAAIVTVYSAVENIARRTAIRETIGRTCEHYKCKVIFVMAYVKNKELMQALKFEYAHFNDILLVATMDSYRHLNDKAVAMLDWILEHCSQARNVIHFVDDTYVNVELFIKDLDTLNTSNAVYGQVDRNIPPVRVSRDKYYASVDQYPYTVYPDFVIGAAYSFPNTVTKKLRCAITKAIYVWLEDVWLTGHVRIRAGIEAIQTKQKVEPYQGRYDLKIVQNYLFIHSIGVEDYYTIFKRIQDSNLVLSNYRYTRQPRVLSPNNY